MRSRKVKYDSKAYRNFNSNYMVGSDGTVTFYKNKEERIAICQADREYADNFTDGE